MGRLGDPALDLTGATTVGAVSARDDGSIDIDGMFRLDGKVAIVTGASSGLGHRFARVLDAAGATVVIAARRVERLEELASDLQRGRRRGAATSTCPPIASASCWRPSTWPVTSTCW